MLEEYMALAHAMQTGVAYEMEIDDNFKDLPDNLKNIFKHLRVGINTALVESGALQGILIDNMSIPAETIETALTEGMRKEVNKYIKILSDHHGVKIELG